MQPSNASVVKQLSSLIVGRPDSSSGASPRPMKHRSASTSPEASGYGVASSGARCPSDETGGPEREQAQAGSLRLWWSMIQDQMASVTREIESLRRANTQLESRQAQIVQFVSEQSTTLEELQQGFVAETVKQLNDMVRLEASHYDNLQGQLTQETMTRDQQVVAAVAVLRDNIAEQKLELHTMVQQMCEKESVQTKTMLTRARQILDTDELLRDRLQSLLKTEMVTKAEFLESQEMVKGVNRRFDELVRPNPPVRQTSTGGFFMVPGPSTERMSPPRMESPRMDSGRGSFTAASPVAAVQRGSFSPMVPFSAVPGLLVSGSPGVPGPSLCLPQPNKGLGKGTMTGSQLMMSPRIPRPFP